MTDNPLEFLFGAAGGQEDIGAALHRIADLLSWTGGPVNWDLAGQLAVQTASEGDSTPTAAERQAVTDALRLADLWLEPCTTLPSGVTTTEAWSRADWIRSTLPAWPALVDEVAGRVVDAMGSALPEEMREAAVTVGDAGIASRMTTATADVQAWIAMLRAEGVFASAGADATWRDLADCIERKPDA